MAAIVIATRWWPALLVPVLLLLLPQSPTTTTSWSSTGIGLGISIVAVVEGKQPTIDSSRNVVFGWQNRRRGGEAPPPSSSSSSSSSSSHDALHRHHAPLSSSSSSSSSISSSSSSSSSVSPLRRRENVFGWQQQQQQRTTTNAENRRRRQQRRGDNDAIMAVQHASMSVVGGGGGGLSAAAVAAAASAGNGRGNNNPKEEDEEIEEESGSLHLPHINLYPRKKELWLPWPLGELRNDYHRFAEQASSDNKNGESSIGARQEWHPRGSNGGGGGGSQQERLRNYYGDDDDYEDLGQNGLLRQGRDWADRMMLRLGVGSALPSSLPFQRGNENENAELQSGGELPSSSPSGYWIRDTTTPMATATASTRKMRLGSISGGGKEKKSKGMGRIEEGVGGDKKQQQLDRDVLCQYLKLQASVRLRQLGYVGSDLSVHLPPVSPILMFYYLLPSRVDPLRRLVRYTAAGATISWMHSEATKYRRFSPLPGLRGVNVRDPDLPPFLPVELPWVDGGGVVSKEAAVVDRANDESPRDGGGGGGIMAAFDKAKGMMKSLKDGGGDEESSSSAASSDDGNPHGHWDPFQSFGTVSSAYRTWLEGRNLRDERAYRRRRVRAQERLLAMRREESDAGVGVNSTALATSSSSKASKSPPPASAAADATTGYALVTGASGGIGRALAVELARYRIPLILVARDASRLSAVASDIEEYYGVPCVVLRADLSEPDAAERIHDATTRAGLVVDVLVNNAGVCAHGEFVADGGRGDLERMLRVNVGTVTELSRLYGRDMKGRRRGRILIVSSMTGVMPGCPSVAAYAGTKAYGKSLAMSLGREMERYGVGVTCLLPGAVKDTNFATKSDVEDAVCFNFPGYAKSPELVAGVGIKGLMLGYPEIYPGWQNRAFVKMFLPMLPPRVSNIIGECAWNPWQWGDVNPQRRPLEGSNNIDIGQKSREDQEEAPLPSPPPSSTWKFLRSSQQSPSESNQMQLPEVVNEPKAVDSPNESAALLLMDPAIDPAPDNQNTTTLEKSKPGERLGMISGGTNDVGMSAQPLSPSDAESAMLAHVEINNPSGSGDKGQQEAEPPKPQAADALSPGPASGSKGVLSENEKEDEAVTQVAPDIKSLVLPPPPTPLPNGNDTNPQASSPMAVFGFFERDKKSPSALLHEESVNDDDSVGGTDLTGDKDGSVDATSSQEDAARSTWYPSMMDNKDYDFRDRRLNY